MRNINENKMGCQFKVRESDSDDDYNELLGEEDVDVNNVIVAGVDIIEDEFSVEDIIRHDDSDNTDDTDSDYSLSEESSDSSDDKPSTSAGIRSSVMDAINKELNAINEDDPTIRAMIEAIKRERKSPPDIKLNDFITDVCFHNELNLIAIASIIGDVQLYEYNNNGNVMKSTIELHSDAIRDMQFTNDAKDLITCSKDKSIMITDLQTERLKRFYEDAHEDAINAIHVIDEHVFSTGDDNGTVKLWDSRQDKSIFEHKSAENQITQMLTNDEKRFLLLTSSDGYLTTLNISARKMFVESEPYDEELSCMGLFRNESKLVVGTSAGNLYTFKWGQFGYHCDKYPCVKSSISLMVPITEHIACIAGEEGVVRACHIAPNRNIGIIGQHNMPIESLDISHDGELIATSSHNNDVCFWNVKYFEDYHDIKYNEKHKAHEDKSHNLPSSKMSNKSDFFAGLAQDD